MDPLEVPGNGERRLLLNITPQAIFLDPGDRSTTRSIQTALATLAIEARDNPRHMYGLDSSGWPLSLDKKSPSSIREVIEAHLSGQLLLSANDFWPGIAGRLAFRDCLAIVTHHPMARRLRSDLENLSFYRIAAQWSRGSEEGFCNRIISHIVMSSLNIESIEDLSPAFCIEWLRTLRTKNNRWRDDLIGDNDRAKSSLRAFGRVMTERLASPEVAAETQVVREHASSNLTWSALRHRAPPCIDSWYAHYRAWLEVERPALKPSRLMFGRIQMWLTEHFGPSVIADVVSFFRYSIPDGSFASFVAKENTPANGLVVLRYAIRFDAFIKEVFVADGKTGPFKSLVTQRDLNFVRAAADDTGDARRRTEVAARPLPKRYMTLFIDILSEGEQGWPATQSRCYGMLFPRDGEAFKGFCPVLPTLFLCMTELPLRLGQMKLLDSGEGDSRTYDPVAGKWKRNTGVHAGFWKKYGFADCERGFAREIGGSSGLTGLFVNTNKTGTPYVVPWESRRLLTLMGDLRKWQEKYNPVGRPVRPDEYMRGVPKEDRGRYKHRPQIFPLFRMPFQPRAGAVSMPPSDAITSYFFQDAMLELERRVNTGLPEDEHVTIVPIDSATGKRGPAIYSPHGIRAEGISRFLDAGVPLDIVSKLIAGHSSFVMTLYYYVRDIFKTHDMLEEGAQKAEADRMKEAAREIGNLEFESGKKRSAHIHDSGVQAVAQSTATERALWIDTGIGFCPWEGTRCYDGGPEVGYSHRRAHSVESKYGPVEGGDRNCLLCRHFVTGPAWLLPLWLNGTKLLRRFSTLQQKITSLQQELDVVHLRHQQDGTVSASYRRKVDHLEGEIDASVSSQVLLAKAIANTQCLLEQCVRILETRAHAESERDEAEGCNPVPAIASEVALVTYQEVGEFQQAALLTAGSRAYPILIDELTERSRNEFIDRILMHNGQQPLTFSSLPSEVKRQSFDALAKLLFERTSAAEQEALASGLLELKDLQLDNHFRGAVPSGLSTLPVPLNYRPQGDDL